MDKDDVVRIIGDIATLLEFAEANAFEVMAFRNGADNLDDWDGDLEQAVTDQTLTDINGVGKGIAGVVSELVQTGRAKKYDDLIQVFPASILELKKVPGLGVKKIKLLNNELGIDSLDALETAAKAQKVRALKGFSASSEERLITGVEQARRYLHKN